MESEQNLDWEDKEHLRDYEDFCDAFSVKNLDKPDHASATEKLVVTDIDNELIGSDQTLLQL